MAHGVPTQSMQSFTAAAPAPAPVAAPVAPQPMTPALRAALDSFDQLVSKLRSLSLVPVRTVDAAIPQAESKMLDDFPRCVTTIEALHAQGRLTEPVQQRILELASGASARACPLRSMPVD